MVKRSPVAVDASPRSALRPERTLAPGAVTTLPTTRGSRERGASSLLGHPAAQVDLFARYRDLDRWLLSSLSTVTGGLTPATGLGAATDWWVHLAASAAKQFAMTHEWVQALLGKPVEPPPQDKRLSAPPWRKWPFSAWAWCFIQTERLWQQVTTGVPGMTRHHEAMVAFWARLWLDMVSPSNGVLSNPVVLERTLRQGVLQHGR